jgi:hypothetical protein
MVESDSSLADCEEDLQRAIFIWSDESA